MIDIIGEFEDNRLVFYDDIGLLFTYRKNKWFRWKSNK